MCVFVCVFVCVSALLQQARSVCVASERFFSFHPCLFVCLFVSNIMLKLCNLFSQKSVEMWHTNHGRTLGLGFGFGLLLSIDITHIRTVLGEARVILGNTG